MEITNVLDMRTQKSQNLRIETDVLRPQYINDAECVFNLRPSGILDGGSRLILPLCGTDANTRLTLSAGCYAVIQNATLRTSKGVVIAQTEDVDYLMTINNSFVEPTNREKRGIVVNGSQMNFEYTTSTGGERGLLGFKTGVAGDIANRFKLNVDANRTVGVEYSVKLAQLFPNLFPFQIPLFLLQDHIQLHITFTDNSNTGRRGLSADGTQANGGQVQIVNKDVKFVSDHLFFGPEVTDKLRQLNNSQNGIVLPYGDYNLLKNSHSGGANPASGVGNLLKTRRNIGLSNLKVRFMLIHNQAGGLDTQTPTTKQLAGLGKYASNAGIGGNELQLVINNENYYPRTITKDNRLFNELEDVYGITPSIPYCLYTWDTSYVVDAEQNAQLVGGTTNIYDTLPSCGWTDNNFFGTSQENNIGGFQIMGVNLATSRRNPYNVGMSIGQQPIEILYNKNITTDRNENILQRCFVCVERLMVIKNGQIMTTNS